MRFRKYRIMPEIIETFEYNLPKIEVDVLDSRMFLFNSIKHKYHEL